MPIYNVFYFRDERLGSGTTIEAKSKAAAISKMEKRHGHVDDWFALTMREERAYLNRLRLTEAMEFSEEESGYRRTPKDVCPHCGHTR